MRNVADLPGRAGHGGYVYAILFESGMVKVGYATDARSRVKAHHKDARTFGTTVADWWVSPVHAEYKQNEEALIEACRSLDGKPVSTEYFHGVDFVQLVERGASLPFSRPAARDEKHARFPKWLGKHIDAYAAHIRYGGEDPGAIAERLAAEIIRHEPGFTQLLVSRQVLKYLRAAVKRKPDPLGDPQPTPEPPEPEPPMAVGIAA